MLDEGQSAGILWLTEHINHIRQPASGVPYQVPANYHLCCFPAGKYIRAAIKSCGLFITGCELEERGWSLDDRSWKLERS